jgi:RNA polymerase sigma factor (sigma-70 family)
VTAREQFEALYSEHGGAVLAYARRRTTPASAEDVVAEVFLTAWRRLEEIPPDARIWLFGVSRRVLANQRRGHARQVALRSRLAEEAQPWSSPVSEDPSDQRVARALSSLSEKDREVLLLLGWEELSPGDAARVLDIRAGTFAVRLHRARKHFAKALQEAPGVARPRNESTQPTEAR